MFYVVKRQNPKIKELTWDLILSGKEIHPYDWFSKQPTGTVTRVTDEYSLPLGKLYKIDRALENFCIKYKSLYEQDRHKLYYKFYIPKSSGGKREINAPTPELKAALNELKYILENVCDALYHTSAFAYVKGRSIKDLDMKHALNESNWFLKTDFKDFFPSISFQFLMQMLGQIYPFVYVNQQALKEAIELAMLDGGLPQGSPLSPMLSNLVMIPFDFKMFQWCCARHMVYTRYADDITISAEYMFNQNTVLKTMLKFIVDINAPLRLNSEKTRFVSNRGKNWLMGLMLNPDHKVTIGHKRKQRMKAALCNFLLDTLHGKIWSVDAAMSLQGKYAYYHMIEGSYFDYVVSRLNNKFNADVLDLLSKTISRSL